MAQTPVNTQNLLDALAAGEAADWEFKSARGGIPGSLWETYGAMANTVGGVIVLGVEDDGRVTGLPDAGKARKEAWDNLNNRNKVSVNLLHEADVAVRELQGKPVLVIQVPQTERRQRPVFVGQNPMTGTFRRNYEGDYRCREDEVRRMFSDSSDEPFDARILDGFSQQDLDAESISQFRNRFASRVAAHPWLKLDDAEFLDKLGAIGHDRPGGKKGLTAAGLLMFGRSETITAIGGVQSFHVDFREHLSDDPGIRWTDRLTFDGTWECNLFQFYQRVILKLYDGLKVPFELDPATMARKGETPVHEALREAVVNCLIHADYQGQGGIIIEKYRDRFEFSNPGYLLLTRDQILRGGISECRNKVLQTMFALLGSGEKAGSGLDKIRSAWQAQNWRQPHLEETSRPDRVNLVLSKLSLLPEDALEALRRRWGAKLTRLAKEEIQALVTALVEGSVCNARLQEISAAHPADISRLLQGLVAAGMLTQSGQKRGATYHIPPAPASPSLPRPSGKQGSNAPRTVTTQDRGLPLSVPEVTTLAAGAGPASETWNQLVALAAPYNGKRVPTAQLRQAILCVCAQHFLTAQQLGQLLGKSSKALLNRYLTPMQRENLLEWRYPDYPNYPQQAYRATPRGRKTVADKASV